MGAGSHYVFLYVLCRGLKQVPPHRLTAGSDLIVIQETAYSEKVKLGWLEPAQSPGPLVSASICASKIYLWTLFLSISKRC